MDPTKVYSFINSVSLNTFLKFARESLHLGEGDIEEAEFKHRTSARELKYFLVDQWHTKTGRTATFDDLKTRFDQFCAANNGAAQDSLPSGAQIHARQSPAAPSSDTPVTSPNRPICRQGFETPAQSHTPQQNMTGMPRDDVGRTSPFSPGSDTVDSGTTSKNTDVERTSVQRPGIQRHQSTVEVESTDDQNDVGARSSDNSLEPSLTQTESETEEIVASNLDAQNKATGYDAPYDQPSATSSDQSENAFVKEVKQKNGDYYLELCERVPSTIEVENCPSGRASSFNKDKRYYPILDKSYKGYILIFNNEFKGVPDYSERKGSDVDVKNLKKLWKEIGGCKVIEKHNLGGNKMKKEIHKFVTSTTRKDCGFVAFFIMSHGDCDYYIRNGKCRRGEGFVSGNDGEDVMISDILEMLENGYPGTTLKETPKLIFFQTCRGQKLDQPLTKSTSRRSVVTDFSVDKQRSVTTDTARTSNILQGYATQPGYQAIRDIYDGTWYINAIVNIFRQYAKDEHVADLMTLVHDAVHDMRDKLGNGAYCMEISETLSTLRRKLHLFPGLENEEY